MPQYNFVTEWHFQAPLEDVWRLIRDIDAWPDWWKYVKCVELIREGDAQDIGSVRRITWTTALPYELTFDSELTSIDHHKTIEGFVSGELSGKGVWAFHRTGSITHVRYDWQVSTMKLWMNLLSPVAKPLFNWNHNKVMQAGYEGLKAKLTPGYPELSGAQQR